MKKNSLFNQVLLVICLSMVFLLLAQFNALSQTLHIDNTHSSIQFTVPFMGVTDVTGNFEGFCGEFRYDEKNLSASQMLLFIDAQSINTALKIRDRDLVNDYLECGEYPIIQFTSSKITSSRSRQFDVVGELFLHGKSRTIQLRMNVIADLINTLGGREIGLKIQPIKLNRNDFGIMENSMGSSSVGDTITTMATVRLRDLKPYRTDFDVKHPNAKTSVPEVLKGSYSDSRTKIRFITYKDRHFMAFEDDDWSWFSELKPVGNGVFKTTSFNMLIEVKENSVTLIDEDKKVILTPIK